jgi:maltose alpha-D-glucosyltransferase/alpha-amylase
VFPPIGQLSYLLTLPHHAFYWFSLAKDTAMPAWRVPASEPLPELVTLVMRNEIGELLAPETKRIIEQEILVPYLARRRWFAAKDSKTRAIAIARADVIRGRARDFVLFEIGVATEGRQDRYFLPAGIVWEDEKPPAIVQQLALARVRQHRRMGFLTDAFAVDALPAAVLASLATGRVEPLPDGELRWLATSQEIPTAPPGAEIRRLSAEQSNTSLILGDIAVLKILRRVQAGRHPQTEMTRYLTEHGYANSPALFGEMVRVDADGAPQTLLIAERFVPNQGDAWQWTLDRVRRGIHAPALTGTHAEAGREAMAAYQPFARVIGKRLAEMHAVLANPTDDPEFTPERVEAGETKAWATAAGEEVDRAMLTLENFTAWQDDAEHEGAKELAALRRPLGAKIQELAEAGVGTLRTRLHGDFHLGQILVAGDDAILIDFEGEPSKPLAERRGKGSPLRDIAGLLRSFDYAAATIAREPAPAGLPTADRRDELLGHFVTMASASFLEGYRTAAAAAEHKWVPDLRSATALIELFLIEKAAYEIGYEAGNRPAWIGIPLRGLIMLAKRLLKRRGEKVDA